MKAIMVIILLIIGFSNSLIADDQAICVDVQEGLNKTNGTMGMLSIDPSKTNASTLIIYVSFSNTPSHSNLPAYTTAIEINNQDFFEEMSYDAHHLHTSTALRPSPNQALRYIADNDDSYYRECFRSHSCAWKNTGGLALLNNEIFNKVHADNPSAFANPSDPTKEVDMVFVNV